MVLCTFFLALSGFTEKAISASYYEGKVMRIIVGHEVGGGYDRIGRLLARHLSRHIPGKPTILVENMPGAQTIIAANYLYNIAKPDGMTIGSFDRGLPFSQLLKLEGVKFDILKFSWIGSAASETMILALRTDLPYKSVGDIRKAKEPIFLAGVGAGASDTQFPILLKEFCDFNIKLIDYPSSAASMLAIERKEVDGRAGSYTSLKPFIERGLMRPMVRSRVTGPEVLNLPVNEDLTTNKMGKTIMAMLASADRVGRPYVAPPKTPGNVMAILRDAFSKVIQDPALKEDAKKMMMSLEYTHAEETVKILTDLMSQPEDVVREFSKYIKF
jgi:tripartite-type tricarboxylate transporter receptor subunit TctC